MKKATTCGKLPESTKRLAIAASSAVARAGRLRAPDAAAARAAGKRRSSLIARYMRGAISSSAITLATTETATTAASAGAPDGPSSASPARRANSAALVAWSAGTR